MSSAVSEKPLSGAAQRGLTLLDYGCGKGRFIEEMRGLNLFSDIAGYDPAVAIFPQPIRPRF